MKALMAGFIRMDYLVGNAFHLHPHFAQKYFLLINVITPAIQQHRSIYIRSPFRRRLPREERSGFPPGQVP